MSSPSHPHSTDRRPAPSRRKGLGRLGRLCLKELRETLRDRRTILTLIVMPLLTYPLLSIIFQSFLVSTFSSSRAITSIVGFDDPVAAATFEALLERGEWAMKEAPSAVKAAKKQGGAGASVEDIQALGESTYGFYESAQLEEDVSNGTVDIGIRLLTKPDPRKQQSLQFELLHQRGSSISRRTLETTSRRLRAVNEEYAIQRLKQLGDPGLLPTSIVYQPVSSSKSMAVSLATLVPMILVLMTITGAVYPAIDLTAGERERGTLEALIAAPVPRMQLLLAKYVAVVTVAMLTATANIIAMTLTLLSTGLGVTIFGPEALNFRVLFAVFSLMVVFAAFFSAVLLSITSFARTFKEAQAYLVPLILVSLAPSLMCLAPGIELNGMLAICPLVNIVLLSRDVLQGTVQLPLALITVLATIIYAAGAISVAAKVFGGDTVIYGGQASWSDLFKRPVERRQEATMPGAFLFLTLLFPIYVLLLNALNVWRPDSIAARLLLTSVVTAVLFGLLPWLAGVFGRIEGRSAFRLRRARILAFLGASILGISLWPVLHQLVVVSRALKLFTISPEQFAIVDTLLKECRNLHPLLIVASMAVIPAIFEELFFRGYLFSALEKRLSPGRTIVITALLFGAFHVLAKSVLATERFLPSSCMGLVLGCVAWRSKSVFPGMLLHACHNGLLVLIFYYRDEIAAVGWGVTGESNLPLKWIGMSILGSVLGALFVNLARTRDEPA